jgi:RimJ/RimL family protein N-acetyltransferase
MVVPTFGSFESATRAVEAATIFSRSIFDLARTRVFDQADFGETNSTFASQANIALPSRNSSDRRDARVADCAPAEIIPPALQLMIVATGSKVALRHAEPADRERVYEWYARSDLTPSFLGPPLYPDHPVPGFEAFCDEYLPYYFDGTRPFDGRALIIQADGADIGFLGFGPIGLLHDVVEIDLWFGARALCGNGRGAEALGLTCAWMQATFGIDRFLMRPSRRNVHALRAIRRAGFRETDLAAAQVIKQLQLPPGDYSDEVLLFRTLNPPPARLRAQRDRVYVFIDSEFTSLAEPRLISLGATATDGADFYCELSDWPRSSCSDFVRETVLPLLDGDAVPHPVAAESFTHWLDQRAQQVPVTLVSDSGFDRWAIADLLGREDLPPQCTWLRVPIHYEQLDVAVEGLGLRRHHALDDARALRRTILDEQH